MVLAQVIFVEGFFATLYYVLSAQSPQAFDCPLTRIDATYFTVSTATTTGMGDRALSQSRRALPPRRS